MTKKISNWNNAQEHEERVINYKSALSANNNKTSIQSSSSGQSPSNSNGNNHSSAHIKPATLKAQIVNNLNNKSANKGNDVSYNFKIINLLLTSIFCNNNNHYCFNI